MPTLKEYNVKLTRLRSTRKLTKTMKLVSVNKLRRAQEAERRVADFTNRTQAIIKQLAAVDDNVEQHPLLSPRAAVRHVLILVITSDRGLCGGFNNNLLRDVAKWITHRQQKHESIRIHCCGRKAHTFLKSRFHVDRFYEHIVSRPDYAAVRHIGQELLSGFRSGRLDEVYVAWNRIGSLSDAVPTIERLMPLDQRLMPGAATEPSWLVEPDRSTVLESSLPTLINLRLYQSLVASAAGEHSARMRAMEQATTNADNLIRRLTLQRNRARQAQITTELTEIVAGAEALR